MNYLIEKQKIYKSAFYPYNDDTITLPHRTRAYIDSSSDEFKHLTIEDKLCNLGFAVTRGMNLHAEIQRDISEHTKNVQYRNYEDNAKKSLFSYIDYLRETENLFTETLLEQRKVDLIQLINLLVEEILLRYNEYPDVNSKEYIVSFISIPLDYTAIINRFDIKYPDDKLACYNYLLTSQESISKATINRDYILYLNRWKELLPKLSGYDLYFAYDMVFPCDEAYVYAYNKKQKGKPAKQLILNIPPEPWSGNILNSKLVILSLNPGYVEHLNKNLANMFKPQMAEEIMEDKRKVLSMEGTKFDYYEPTRILGDYYWRKKLLPLGVAVYGEQDKEKIFNHVSLCQYFAYTSLESPSIKDLFPSQKFTKMVLLYLATSVKEVKFLVMRHEAQWKKLMGDGLWNYLYDNNRLLVSKNYANQCLTEKNIGTANYTIMIEHLKKN
ncbi:hypothetical protein [uncultured Bacteroides sp.]|uniref:hypothetical protein n=1 Tax=uncultured Bacteroides sp. TaxID=162156 RepID=UPI00280B7DD1|nr:hypothetical protein [uncultured Bacteroides sp.]